MKVKKQGWINIGTYKGIDGVYHDVDGPWKSKEVAIAYHLGDDSTIRLEDTIQIKWEEEV
jgi:hypothetical protein